MFAVSPRITAAPFLALAVTAMLFLLMEQLIRGEDFEIIEPKPAPPLSWARLVEEQPPEIKKIEPPPEVEPPPTTLVKPEFVTGGDVPLAVSRWQPPPGAGTVPRMLGSGAHIPILTVAPDYPRGALQRGIEGYVVVSFTIDPLGRVVALTVLYSEPARVFDRAALRAVSRYKYKPKLVDGVAVAVPNVRQRIAFKLSG